MDYPEVEPRLSAEQVAEQIYIRRSNELDYGASLVEQNPAIHDAEQQADSVTTAAPENNMYYGNFQKHPFAELAEKDDLANEARKQIDNLPAAG